MRLSRLLSSGTPLRVALSCNSLSHMRRARRHRRPGQHAVELLEDRTLLAIPTGILLDHNQIDENTDTSQNVLIGYLSAVDPDAGDTHTFRLVAGTGADHNNSFELKGNRLELKAGTILDHDQAPVLSFRVEVYDGTHRFQRPLQVQIRRIDKTPPELTSPAGTITDRGPLFKWSQVTGAAAYELEVVNLTNGSTALARQQLPENQYQALPSLLAGQNHQWRVRASYANGEVGDWSQPLEFTLLAPPPLPAPDPVLSPIGSVPTTQPEFRWPAVEGATRYDIWVNDLTTGQSAVIRENHVSSTSFTPATPLIDGHNYIWTVRAISGLSLPGDWAQHRIFGVRVPVPLLPGPEIVGPVATTLTGRPRFQWKAVPGAHHYDVWVNNLTTKESGVIRVKTVPGTELPTADPLPNGHSFIWTVRAIDMSGRAGHWAPHRIFKVVTDVPVPGRPELIGPIGFKNSVRPTFEWSTVLTATRYDIWVNNVTTGQSAVIRNQSVQGTTFTPTFDLQHGHRYIWTVRGINELGQAGPWGEHRRFTVLASVSDMLEPETELDENPATPNEQSVQELRLAEVDDVLTSWPLLPWWERDEEHSAKTV